MKTDKYNIIVNSAAVEYFRRPKEQIAAITAPILNAHLAEVESGSCLVKKNAPESAVSIISLDGLPKVCVKEFRWRGFAHSLKGLFRPRQSVRTFDNGVRLSDLSIGVAAPLVLFKRKSPIARGSDWVIMEAPDATELDRYVLARRSAGWNNSEKAAFAQAFGSFVGKLHAERVFHSDLKTCNILVSESSEMGGFSFRLIDYDDITVGELSEKRRIKNITQIFLSTPLFFGPSSRMRFVREYARETGLSKKTAREICLKTLSAARGRAVLYVGPDGDVIERWD
jgi:hypothetical protein